MLFVHSIIWFCSVLFGCLVQSLVGSVCCLFTQSYGLFYSVQSDIVSCMVRFCSVLFGSIGYLVQSVVWFGWLFGSVGCVVHSMNFLCSVYV